jgi:hypothetical protein
MGITLAAAASYAALAGTAIQVVSAIQQGNTARKDADTQAQHSLAIGEYQKRQAEADAAVQQSEAQLQARQIRAAGDRQRSDARASLAASGVTVGTGTAELIDKEINKNAEQDALTTILSGDTRAEQIRQGGKIAEMNSINSANAVTTRGKNAQTAGYVNGFSSALSGAGRLATSWSSAAKTDPVGNFYQRGTRGSGD